MTLVRGIHLHIGYVAELAWSANKVFLDLGGQVIYRQKVANAEPEAHRDIRPSTSDTNRDIGGVVASLVEVAQLGWGTCGTAQARQNSCLG